jgi:hypothetical protein
VSYVIHHAEAEDPSALVDDMEKVVRIAGEGIFDFQEGFAVFEFHRVRKEEDGGVLNAVVIGAI